MSDGEREDVKLLRFTNRSASVVAPSTAADGDEASGSSFYDPGGFMFHTGPLMRSRSVGQFVPTSGPLYGGCHSGTHSLRDEASGSTFHDAGHGSVTFHTGPLRRSPAAARFVPMSCLLSGGRHSGTPPLPSPEMPSGNPSEVVPQEVGAGEYDAGRKDHLLNSCQLGMCNDPYCATCPGAYHANGEPPRRMYRASTSLERRLRNILYEDGWARKCFSFVDSSFPIMNPHSRVVRKWNRVFVISCLIAIFIDPLFFFISSVDKEHMCTVFNSHFAIAVAVMRSVTDIIYLLYMLLQLRLAYVAPESIVSRARVWIDEPLKIALHYLRGYFLLDLVVVLPLPQVMILVVVPVYLGSSAAYYAYLLRATVLLQYIPRMFRLFHLLDSDSNGFIFASLRTNVIINLSMFVFVAHIVGSCWYLFGLQRVNQCLRNACHGSGLQNCRKFMYCGSVSKFHEFSNESFWESWTACLSTDSSFNYGIYQQAALITQEPSIVVRYIYSLFWGFQQISTLAGNQVPSKFISEVLFTMVIIASGLLLFPMLIGNMQNLLQERVRRIIEMQQRLRNVEQWMTLRRLPEYLRSQVRQAVKFSWVATRGFSEEKLLENLPEGLQRDIRCHLFEFPRKVRIFQLMDKPILDAIREKLRQKLYIAGNYVQYQGDPIEKIVFIVQGKMESIGKDGYAATLSDGDVCGEELMVSCLEQSSLNKDGGKIRFQGHRLLSNRTVRCLTNVEAFALQSDDLQNISALFARFLRNPRVQGAIRYESPYWRTLAATRIQLAWRYRKRRLYTKILNQGILHIEQGRSY